MCGIDTLVFHFNTGFDCFTILNLGELFQGILISGYIHKSSAKLRVKINGWVDLQL